MRVLHIINCLSLGGAERQLLRLAAAQRGSGDEVRIVTLLDKDTLRSEADDAGVPVTPLALHGPLALPRTLRRLRRAIADFEPDAVQSWLYWANLASLLALGRNPRRRRVPLAWNIRQTLPDLAHERWAMRTAIRLGARWSSRIDALVYNAETAREQHRAFGYRAAREVVIPNALDVDRVPFGSTARAEARRALALPSDARVVIHAARFHPMKDHAGFLDAIAPLLARDSDCIVLLFGRSVTAERLAPTMQRHPALTAALASQRLRFPGERLDLAALLPAADCFVSSSAWGEAFPNVVAEAMAAAIPVVATDVGDARSILGDCGRIVPARDPGSLGEALTAMLALTPAESAALGLAARRRIADRTAIASILDSYRQLWRSIAAPRDHA